MKWEDYQKKRDELHGIFLWRVLKNGDDFKHLLKDAKKTDFEQEIEIPESYPVAAKLFGVHPKIYAIYLYPRTATELLSAEGVEK